MVAVSLVVFYHFGYQWVPGAEGVLAFFVLSGFLITWLLLKEEDQSGEISLGLFYLRRALRIFPAFYCYWIVLTAYLIFENKPIVWGQALSSLFYVNNYYQAVFGDPSNAYSHTWSLGIEEQFYLLWPFCFIALGLTRRRTAFLILLIAGIWIYRAMLELTLGFDQGYIYEAFDTRADHLAVGCLLAVLLHNRRLPGLWERLSTISMSLLTLALLSLSVYLNQSFGTLYRDVFGFAVEPVLVAILIVQTMALSDTPLWRWLNWRWVMYLGALSYSIYLYHQVAGDFGRKIFAAYEFRAPIIGSVAAIIVTASCSYHVIERPFLRLKHLALRPLRGACKIVPEPFGSKEPSVETS